MQRRAYDKYHSGGLIANTCCSHPRQGEVLEEAVHRRLQEEMNFDCSLQEVFSFVYFHRFTDNLFEYEFDHVFLGEYKDDFRINCREVAEAWWEGYGFLEQDMLSHPEKYSVWFLTAAPRVLAVLRDRKIK
ncbi:Isopentenyl-diphosphate Delta-isomerase [bioreactor metagenome]|uniref:isopentenyl-diphosphate Delta-isomerase n=1 Tax=bioreactor metagenome TaxID=1076179 RepID=A0A645J712_9ZZZZ